MTKYQKYVEYKDSGVEALGLIPKGWSILRGKFLFKEINERSESGEETLLSVSEYYGVKPREEKIADGDFLTRAESLEGYKKCYPNDLVMNIMLAWKRGLGVSKYEGIVSPAYSVFRFSEQVNSDYIHYLLRTEEYTKYFKTRSTGIIDSRLRLYPESFGDIFILFPTLETQTQIANFLDYETAKIDTLIAKQEKLIELLKEKRQAVISHAVTKGLNPNVPMKDSGVEWLGEVPEHWKIKENKYLLDFITSGSRGWAQYYADTGALFFRIANLTRDTIEPKLDSLQFVEQPQGSEGERSKIKIGDLLISITADLGSVCVANSSIQNGYVSQHVALCRPQKLCEPRWLAYYILSDTAKEQLLGSGYGGTKIQLSLEDIRELVIAVPPKKEQMQIANYIDEKLSQFEYLIKKADKLVGILKERRTALISAAVTGKIDVRNWQNPNKNNNQDKMELSA